MTMQASFDRAITDGAKIVGVTTVPQVAEAKTPVEDTKLVDPKAPQNPPQTLQENDRNLETRKSPEGENLINNWECLVSALADLPSSYPSGAARLIKPRVPGTSQA